ncbi:lipoprotein, tandem type [Leptospira kirschneri]|uniref:lipoprotein, tandem type n=1 Tax=Leptospira kirschneri TaxID=29507 RepID=UPI0009E5B00B|nr:lipoprotein, tandem type [Leptospira kirschneri]
MKKDYKSIFVMISILAFTFTGCKKTPEELAKEEDAAKRKAVAENIGSVYGTFVNGLTLLLDEDAQALSKKRACFEFKPKEGKAAVKFYQHPTVYNLSVKTKNELEYLLTYKGKEAELKLNLKGQLPVKDSNKAEVLQAELAISGPKGFINDIDVAYKYVGDVNEDSVHARFVTIEACEEKYTRDDEIGSQESTCEGPGCY